MNNKYVVLLTIYQDGNDINQKFIECETYEEAQKKEKELQDLYSSEKIETSIYPM